jgi:LysM repeat protein
MRFPFTRIKDHPNELLNIGLEEGTLSSKSPLFIAFIIIITQIMGASPVWSDDQVETLQARVEHLERLLKERPRDPGAYPTPKEIKFCSDKISLKDLETRRRFEKELLLILTNRAQVQLYINRARAVFPVIEREAKAMGRCSDLKHVAVIESGLRGGVTSHANAKGWWQFMSPTARDFKLVMTSEYDERSNLKTSTRAALKYLHALRKRLGSWPLAMAAYNTGPGRLRRSQSAQKHTSFWHLDLFTEAERYVPRILAVHHIMTHLKEYDFHRGIDRGWPADELIEVQVTLKPSHYQKISWVKVKAKKSKSRSKRKRGKRKRSKKRAKKERRVKVSSTLNVLSISLALKMNLRDFRRVNPALVGKRLPLGIPFSLWIPPGSTQRLKGHLGRGARIRELKPSDPVTVSAVNLNQPSTDDDTDRGSTSPQRNSKIDPQKIEYTVQLGDSLWLIAHKSGVSVDQLRAWNMLSNRAPLRQGQILAVRPPQLELN